MYYKDFFMFMFTRSFFDGTSRKMAGRERFDMVKAHACIVFV